MQDPKGKYLRCTAHPCLDHLKSTHCLHLAPDPDVPVMHQGPVSACWDGVYSQEI